MRRPPVILAVLCAATLALQFGQPHYTNASVPQRAFGEPNISLQFARGTQDIDDVLGEAPSPDREVLRIKLYFDFAFIASYVALFLSLSFPLIRAGGKMQVAGIAAAICGFAAGAFDVLENLAEFRILDVPLRFTTASMINAIRSAAIAKWWLAAVTLALFGSYMARPGRASRIGGTAALICAVLMAVGVLYESFT